MQFESEEPRRFPPRRWLGIDFSGDAEKWRPGCTRSNVWIAEVVESNHGLHLQSLRQVQSLDGDGIPFSRLARLLAKREFLAAGIDAPFSVPALFQGNGGHSTLLSLVSGLKRDPRRPFPKAQDFVDAVVTGRTISIKKPYRETERFWKERGINVRSTMWAKARGGAAMTAACLQLLNNAGCPIWPWVPNPPGLLVEAFPAAQLKHWGLPYQKYSDSDSASVQNRRKIVQEITTKGLLLGEYQPILERSTDALDSLICAFAGIAVTEGKLYCNGLGGTDEGLIAVHV